MQSSIHILVNKTLIYSIFNLKMCPNLILSNYNSIQNFRTSFQSSSILQNFAFIRFLNLQNLSSNLIRIQISTAITSIASMANNCKSIPRIAQLEVFYFRRFHHRFFPFKLHFQGDCFICIAIFLVLFRLYRNRFSILKLELLLVKIKLERRRRRNERGLQYLISSLLSNPFDFTNKKSSQSDD
jgi:hypothetical protein